MEILPGAVKNTTVFIKSNEFVRTRDSVKITLLPIVEISVWFPYSLKHGNTQC